MRTEHNDGRPGWRELMIQKTICELEEDNSRREGIVVVVWQAGEG